MKKLKDFAKVALITTASISAGFWFSACKDDVRSEEEKKYENEIRKILELDAKIDIDEFFINEFGFNFSHEITDKQEYLLSFDSRSGVGKGGDAIRYKVTYSVDENTFYDFKYNYSVQESQKEVDMVYELASLYDPINVVSPTRNIDTNKEIKNAKLMEDDFVM